MLTNTQHRQRSRGVQRNIDQSVARAHGASNQFAELSDTVPTCFFGLERGDHESRSEHVTILDLTICEWSI